MEYPIIPVKNCIINKYFLDAGKVKYQQRKYCFENCQLKCIKNIEYKLIK